MKIDIAKLLQDYSIDDIESGLIRLFIKKNNLKVSRCKLILDKIKKGNITLDSELGKYHSFESENFSLKKLERMFELLIEEGERKINGAFYTPTNIVEYIVETAITKDGTVCDPACGSGAFLVSATERLHKLTKKSFVYILENRIYGSDVSKRSIDRTKLILSLLALLNGEEREDMDFNLVVNDSLKMNWESAFPNILKLKYPNSIYVRNPKSGFDFVIGNPPYVRIQNLDNKTRETVREKWLSAYKYNVDLYIPFIELALKLINQDGKVCFIVSKSFFDSDAGKKIRDILRSNKYIDKILDFNYHQVFEDVITYTAIITLDKQPKDSFSYCKVYTLEEMEHLEKLTFREEKYSELPEDKIVINGHRDKQNLKKISSQPIRIGDYYPVKIGVATLSDDLYLINNGRADDNHYIKMYDGKEYQIEKEITQRIMLANNIKSKKTKPLFDKIIFPYKRSGEHYHLIDEHLIKESYPLAYKYLQAVKPKLMGRDKGQDRVNGYGSWYAYGRVQGYNAIGEKVVCPTMMPEPRFELIRDNTLFIAGYSYLTKNDGRWLIKILNSTVFWYYITKEAKKIRNEFWVVNKKILENFYIPSLTQKQKDFLGREENQDKINRFLISKYGILI